jgi:predicted ferric reductase
MLLIVRGIIWYGLYLFLILLPLLTAALSDPTRASQPFLVELAVGAGFVGFSLMALEFALISRINAAAQPFGEDSLQLFHNLMGMVALGFILIHPLLLIFAGYPAKCWINPFSSCANIATRTAVISVIVLLMLVGSSLFRKKIRLRYEPWQVMHGIFALVVLFTALVHMFIIGRYTSTVEMQAVWLLYSVLVLGLIGRYKIWNPLKNWGRPWELVENRAERGDAHTLVLKPVGHPGFSFHSGQFAWIKSGKLPFGPGQHPISISSSGDVEPGGKIQFTVKELGDWSGKEVPELRPGDRMWVDGPYGVFTIDREQAMGYVLVGGGVGITPLFAMLQMMAEREDVRPILLFYGATDSESMTFKEELRDLTGKLNLQIIPVMSDPEKGWDGETGYINAEIMKKHLPWQYKWFKYLICGPKPLMDAMEEALPELGVPPQSVLTERFDMI